MSHSLYGFMPYGAPDLISSATSRMFRATMSSMVLWMIVFAAVLGAMILRPRTMELETRVFVPYREIAAPPPLRDNIAPPVIAVMPSAATPAIGMPVPVPDTEAPAEQTIASQQEISSASGSGPAGGIGEIVIEPPSGDELPQLGEYVYADELPVLVKDVPPHYPEIARQAELEGDVLLRVLIGKDGRVAKVHVDTSIPMLDAAAVDAARMWVFTPALSNNRPVAVWITRLLKFRLTAAPAL